MNRGKRFLASTAAMSVTWMAAVSADDSATDVRAIEQAYGDWMASVTARDIERWSTFLAEDALFLPPGEPALETHDAILNFYITLFADPNFSLNCQQNSVEVAESRDLAWSTGKCRATFSTPKGEMGSGSSKWTKVWKRQSDGFWRCALNTWNLDPQAVE